MGFYKGNRPMNRRALAQSTYLRFSGYDGSRHIASEFALNKLLEVTRIFKTRSILEIGLGIGTIVHLLLENILTISDYYGTEPNDFCREQLKINLSPETFNRLVLVDNFNELQHRSLEFDLVIVDGKSFDLNDLKSHLSKHAIIAIEGDRQPQVDVLLKLFPETRVVNSESFRKNHSQGVFHAKDWQGGIRFIMINPTFKQNLFYFKERVRTKLAYTYRRLKNLMKLI